MVKKKITISIDEATYEMLKTLAKDFNLKNNHQNNSNTSKYIYNFIIEESVKNLYSTYKRNESTNDCLNRLNKESSIREALDSMKIKIAIPRGRTISDIVKISNKDNKNIKIKCRQCDKWQDINKILKDCPKNKEADWQYFRNCCKKHKI